MPSDYLYKPRRQPAPQPRGEVDTSLTWLLVGIVGLLLLLVSLFALLDVTGSSPAPDSEGHPGTSPQEIGAPPFPAELSRS